MSRRVLRAQFGPILAVVAALSLLRGLVHVQLATASIGPELPGLYVDTTYLPASGQTLVVHAGEDFQATLKAAQPGDVIMLQAGATFTGPFTLPNKAGSGWIVIRTSAPDSQLPPPGTRIDPFYASVMPKLEAASGWVITVSPGAHHYRFIGVEILPKRGVFLHNLVLLGKNETSVDELPHHIVFDRCYLHGDPQKGSRRGIAMNSRHTAVIDSYLSDFKEVGADSQAIASWNGAGPFKIANNYLEGAGENVIFGGADPSITNLVPSDIEIRQNYFNKPLTWKTDDPSYAGIHWSVKNLLELKNAQRVLVDGNLFEYNWLDVQNGFSVLFTVRNQDGTAPWSVVQDVTFTNNIVRHVAQGINILGLDWPNPSQQTKRILIKNNLFDDLGGTWGGGFLLQVLSGTAYVTFDHNTAFQTGNILMAEGTANTGFSYTNNISPHNAYGVIGTGTGLGNPTLIKYFPGGIIKNNAIAGGHAAQYPSDNFFPASLADVRFRDWTCGDYRLADSSPYKSAGTDRSAPGVDFEMLWAAMETTSPRHPSCSTPRTTNTR